MLKPKVKLSAAQLLAILALSLIVCTFTSNIIPSASADPEGDPIKSIIFYLHYNNATPYINGYETFYIMNTTQQWSTAPSTVKNLQKLYHYWYLYPTLASDYTLNGVISLGIWINATGTTPSGTPTITLYERDLSGTETEVYSYTFGSMTLYNVPSYLNLTIPDAGTYTFHKGSSIKLYFEIVVGAATYAQLWFDTITFDSRLILGSVDYMRLSSVKIYDANETETSIFSVHWSDTQRKVVIRANVTDPFGGYDVYQVNVTLINPADQVIVLNQTMTKISGNLFSYSNLYEANWTYPADAVLGNYRVVVTAVDNSGYSYYNGATGVYGSYGPYLERGYTTFFIGTPYFVQIKATDTHGEIIEGALIQAISSEVVIDQGYTNATGWWTATLYSGYYNITVFWHGTMVAKTPVEVTESAGFQITCSVYYPTFKVVDDVDSPLPEAQVYIKSPNGTINILPMYTTENGFVNLTQVPLGSYEFTVLWKGVTVKQTTQTVDSDGPYTIKCQVYELTVQVLGNDGNPVRGAYVVIDTQAGIVYDFKMSDASGQATFKLPVGTYKIEAYYSTVYWLTHVVANATKPSVTVASSHTETITFSNFPPPLWTTTMFWLLLAFAIFITVLGAFYFLYKRGRRFKGK